MGAEAVDKERILGRYQSCMGHLKETARAKLGQSCFQYKRAVYAVVEVVGRGGRAWSWVRFVIKTFPGL